MHDREAMQALLDGKAIRDPIWDDTGFLELNGNHLVFDDNSLGEFTSSGHWALVDVPSKIDEVKALAEELNKGNWRKLGDLIDRILEL